jgi:plastocyanin
VRLGVSALVVLTVATAGLACDATTTTPSKVKSVTVGDNYFAPDNYTVSVGDTVLFIWAGSATHDVVQVSNSMQWCSPRGSGFCSVAFLVKGSFPYLCSYHSLMQGTIEVQ